MRRAQRVILASMLLAAFSGGSAVAAPRVDVRGRAKLQIVSIVQSRAGSQIHGRLTDATMENGLARRQIVLQVELTHRLRRFTTWTRRNGRFSALLPLPSGVFMLTPSFAGDRWYQKTSLKPRLVDTTKLSVHIRARATSELSAANKTQPFSVTTIVGGAPGPLTVDIHLEGRRIDHFRTNADGHANLAIDTALISPPGRRKLTFRFAGDRTHNPASTTLDVLLRAPVYLTLTAAKPKVAASGQIELFGTIRDHRGPLANAPISLQAMSRHIEGMISDKKGRFAVSVDAAVFPPGPLDIRASYSPPVLWQLAARSKPVSIEVLPPRPIPVRLYAIPTAISAILLLSFWLWRVRHLLPKRIKQRVTSQHDSVSKPVPEAATSGVRLAKPRHIRRQDFGISGSVWDGVDQRPIARATVQLVIEGQAHDVLTTSDSGGFEINELAAGEHTLTVATPGYVPETFAVQIPHRGNLRGFRVDLVAVRVRVLEQYRGAAMPRLARDTQWARVTPSELLAQQPATADFRELSRLLENTYWSKDTPTIEALEQARELTGDTTRR
jgi:hypothetical protein